MTSLDFLSLNLQNEVAGVIAGAQTACVCAATGNPWGQGALETRKRETSRENSLHLVCIVSQDSNLTPKNDNDGRLSD